MISPYWITAMSTGRLPDPSEMCSPSDDEPFHDVEDMVPETDISLEADEQGLTEAEEMEVPGPAEDEMAPPEVVEETVLDDENEIEASLNDDEQTQDTEFIPLVKKALSEHRQALQQANQERKAAYATWRSSLRDALDSMQQEVTDLLDEYQSSRITDK